MASSVFWPPSFGTPSSPMYPTSTMMATAAAFDHQPTRIVPPFPMISRPVNITTYVSPNSMTAWPPSPTNLRRPSAFQTSQATTSYHMINHEPSIYNTCYTPMSMPKATSTSSSVMVPFKTTAVYMAYSTNGELGEAVEVVDDDYKDHDYENGNFIPPEDEILALGTPSNKSCSIKVTNKAVPSDFGSVLPLKT